LFAFHLLEFLVDPLARSPEQLRQLFLGQLQADADRFGVRQTRYTITAQQVVELFGQSRTQGQCVEVFHQAVKLSNPPGLKAQHGFVELDVLGQNFLEVGLGHIQGGGVAVCIAIVRAPVAVEDRDIAKPDAWLHVSQRDLFARHRG